MAEKCTQFIFSLSKSAKLNWGLNRAAPKTIYAGELLPLLLYGAQVWKRAIDKVSYKLKVVRVQRLINIKIAKAYRTVSNEALLILTGLTPWPYKLRSQLSPQALQPLCSRVHPLPYERKNPGREGGAEKDFV
jgi:hypothetical protein